MSLEGLIKDYQDHHLQQQQQQQHCPFCREPLDLGSLKEHLDGGCRARPPSSQPSPPPPQPPPPSASMAITGTGQYGCLQCNAAFSNRDLLEKHELLHSPNAQVVSYIYLFLFFLLSLKRGRLQGAPAALR